MLVVIQASTVFRPVLVRLLKTPCATVDIDETTRPQVPCTLGTMLFESRQAHYRTLLPSITLIIRDMVVTWHLPSLDSSTLRFESPHTGESIHVSLAYLEGQEGVVGRIETVRKPQKPFSNPSYAHHY